VTIVDDDVYEVDETVVLSASVSGLSVTDATLTIVDDDRVTISVSDTALLLEPLYARSADGDYSVDLATGSYTLTLSTEPTSEVCVTTVSADPNPSADAPPVVIVHPKRGNSGSATQTHCVEDVATPLTIKFFNIDPVDKNQRQATITHTVSSSDSRYDGIEIPDVRVTVRPKDRSLTPRPTTTTGGGGTPSGGGNPSGGGTQSGGGAPNETLVFASAAVTRSVAENSPAGTPVGDSVTANNPDGDTLQYSLTGPDAALFDINPSSGQITVKTGANLDYETKTSYTITVTVTNPNGATATTQTTINITNITLPDQAANYDTNNDETLDTNETLNAVQDYANNQLTLQQLINIIKTYLNNN
jgi:hypothetical protein